MAVPEGRKSVAEGRPGRHIRHTFDAALVVAETKRHRIFDTDDSPRAALAIALGVYTVVAILRSFWAY